MNADPIASSSAESATGAGSSCPARRSIGCSRANVTARDERLGHALVRIVDGVDRVGDRGEEALGLAPHQRLDQVVAARVAAVGRHPGHAGAADHVLDRNPLQPNGRGLLQARRRVCAGWFGRPTRRCGHPRWRRRPRRSAGRRSSRGGLRSARRPLRVHVPAGRSAACRTPSATCARPSAVPARSACGSAQTAGRSR